MTRTNRTVRGLTASALLLGSIFLITPPRSLAQTRIGVAGLGNQVAIAPGTYEDIKVDSPEFIQAFQGMDAADSDWIRNAVSEINETVNQLKLSQAELQKAANRSMQMLTPTGEPTGMPLQTYLEQVTAVRLQIDALKTKIEVLTAVPTARNSNNVAKLDTGKMVATINGRMQSIDISGIKKIMDDKFANVLASINQITFYIEARNPGPKGPRVDQKVGDVLDKSLLSNFSPEEINQLTFAAQKREKNALEKYSIEVNDASKRNVKMLQSLINTYGVTDRTTIVNDEAGMKTAMATIDTIYLSREVLRYKFAAAIGAFGTPDIRRRFSMEQVPLLNSNQIVIDEDLEFNQQRLMEKRRYIFTVLQQQKLWAGEKNGTGSLERLSRPLSNLANLINWAALKETWSRLNAFVLQHMMNEIEQEQMINEPGGIIVIGNTIKARIARSADPQAMKAKVAEILSAINTADGAVAANSSITASGTNDGIKKIATSVKRFTTEMNYANSLRKQAADLRKDVDAYASGQNTRGEDLLK